MPKETKYICDKCKKEVRWWYKLIIVSNYGGLSGGTTKYLCGICMKKVEDLICLK